MRRLHTGGRKCKGHIKLKPTQPPPRNDGSKGTKEICQRTRQKLLSQPARTKLQDKKKRKRTLNEKREMQSGTNHAVPPEEETGRGTNIAPKAEIGTHGKKQMLMRKRKLTAGARAKKRRERRKSTVKRMTKGDAQAARTGKRKMPKSGTRRASKKTEAKKGANNIQKGMRKKSQKRWKRRRMESSDVTDLEAEKRVVTGHGGPGPEGATSVANHATEAVTDATAAAGTEDHLAGREAESETDATAGETQKTETRERVQRSQRAKRAEDETEAPKNGPPRDREAESEMTARAAGRGRRRATVEAAIQRAMLINRRKEKGARVRNLKRGQRTNLKVQ